MRLLKRSLAGPGSHDTVSHLVPNDDTLIGMQSPLNIRKGVDQCIRKLRARSSSTAADAVWPVQVEVPTALPVVLGPIPATLLLEVPPTAAVLLQVPHSPDRSHQPRVRIQDLLIPLPASLVQSPLSVAPPKKWKGTIKRSVPSHTHTEMTITKKGRRNPREYHRLLLLGIKS